jgi:hypothetical protein
MGYEHTWWFRTLMLVHAVRLYGGILVAIVVMVVAFLRNFFREVPDVDAPDDAASS